MSRTSAATRKRVSRTSAGRTRGTRSRTTTDACPASRGRLASCRATPTTRSAWRPPGAAGLEGSGARRGPRSAGGRPQGPLQPGLLGRGRRFFALALDSEGKQVDALSSNNGHLLWSGIVDKSKAKAVVRHLMGPRLFSGWGVARSPRARAVQPDRLPRRHGVAVRLLLHRLGPAELRLQGRGGADRRRNPSTRRSSSTDAFRRPSAATSAD